MPLAPQVPTLLTEFLRLADALTPVPPGKYADGATLYVIASTRPPLHRIQGIYTDPAQAEAQLLVPPPPDAVLPWDPQDVSARAVYVVVWQGDIWPDRERDGLPPGDGATGDSTLSLALMPCVHLSDSTPCCATYVDQSGTAVSIDLAQVRSMALVVAADDDTVYTFPLSQRTDALFLTRQARQKFMAPHYAIRMGGDFLSRAVRLAHPTVRVTVTSPRESPPPPVRA